MREKNGEKSFTEFLKEKSDRFFFKHYTHDLITMFPSTQTPLLQYCHVHYIQMCLHALRVIDGCLGACCSARACWMLLLKLERNSCIPAHPGICVILTQYILIVQDEGCMHRTNK